MARRTEETTIRGRTFKVTQVPGWRGATLFYQMAAVIIPALVKLGKGLTLLDNLGSVNIRDIASLVPEMFDAATFLFEKMPSEEFERFAKELLQTATVKPLDGGKEQLLLPIFDDEMAGETSAIFQLVGFALSVNYGNFIPGLVAQARSLQATKAASASPELTTSPGPVGGLS